MDLSTTRCACCGAPMTKISKVTRNGQVKYVYVATKKYCDDVCRKHMEYVRIPRKQAMQKKVEKFKETDIIRKA